MGRITPTVIKKITGRRNGRDAGGRPINENEPTFNQLSDAEPPSYLGVLAQEEWRRVTKMLSAVNMLTEADLVPLTAYCTAYGRWIECERIVASEGVTTSNSVGVTIKNPYYTIMREAMLDTINLAREFGMTPCSRTKIMVLAANETKPKNNEKGAEYFE
jgi:P27 family predicted phage terminase small subunit